MRYQLPRLSNEKRFEQLVRDLLRRTYGPEIELFGRSGQQQHGVDGTSSSIAGIKFQCKLKDVTSRSDEAIRKELLEEFDTEFEKARLLAPPPNRYILASTFKNDSVLQLKAESLSTEVTTVEYWGWETIASKVWAHPEEIVPEYFPEFPIRQVSGLTHLDADKIETLKTDDDLALREIALEYYRINDSDELLQQVIANDVDVPNEPVLQEISKSMDGLEDFGTIWITGFGGAGKTTILHRVAADLAREGQDVFFLNLEHPLEIGDLKHVFSLLKYSANENRAILCIDNPAANEEVLTHIFRHVRSQRPSIHILLAERYHRYKSLKASGALVYIPGETDPTVVPVRNTREQRKRVYTKLFDLLGISASDRAPLEQFVADEKLVYVNATYRILLELKRNRKIDFDFDWDDYRKKTVDLPSFTDVYSFIALFYLFGVRSPFSVLSRLFGADDAQKRLFVGRFRTQIKEPIILQEREDEAFRRTVYVRTKHEIISELYFEEHQIDKTELMLDWCKVLNFADPVECQSLIDVFGLKKNYLTEPRPFDFDKVLDFLLDGYLSEEAASSPKLKGTLFLAKAWQLTSQGLFQMAAELLEDFVQLTPTDIPTRTELAKIYRHLGMLDKAKSHLDEVLRLKPNDLMVRTELAKIYQRQGELTEAESVLIQLLELDPQNLQARTELAKIYQRQWKLPEAEAHLNEILRLKPKDLMARTELAKIYQRQGKLEEAEAHLNEILRLKPKDLMARTELAKIYQRQGRLEEAVRRLEEYIALDPRGLHPRTELAKIYQRQGKLEEAEKRLLESLAIDDKQLHPRTELAKIYQRQGRLEEAIRRLEEYIALDPRGLHPRTELAKIYQRQGRWKEAEAAEERVLEIDPQNNHALAELITIWDQQNMIEVCIHRFFQFIEQPGFHFTNYFQAPVFRFFRFCKKHVRPAEARKVYELFGPKLDDTNRKFFTEHFNSSSST